MFLIATTSSRCAAPSSAFCCRSKTCVARTLILHRYVDEARRRSDDHEQASRRYGIELTPSGRPRRCERPHAIAATALSLTRRDAPDVVRTASKSKKRPPTSITLGDDSCQ